MKVWIRSDPFYGTLFSPVEDDTAPGQARWVGMPERKDFIDQVNNAIVINSYSIAQIVAGLRILPWSDTAFANNNPDYSDYAEWLLAKKGTTRQQGNPV